MNDLSKVSIKRIDGLEDAIAEIYRKIDAAAKTGVAHNVGEVFWSQSNLAAENPGALPLFTGDHVSKDTYGALYNFLLRNSNLVVDKEYYDKLIATNGELDCPYYAIDNDQIYLPRITSYLNYVRVGEKGAGVYYAWKRVDSDETRIRYTITDTPAIGDPVTTTPGVIGTSSAILDVANGEIKLRYYKTGNIPQEKWFYRSKSEDVAYVGTEKNALLIDESNLYPWVSYVESKYDIVTADSYANSDLSNVVTISDSSPVQHKLTAGANITIQNNEISSTAGVYTAGANITIDANNEISATDTKYTAGNNITIDSNNVISATAATYSAGEGVNIANGEISIAPATANTFGGVKIVIDPNTGVVNIITTQ